jgi:hypothetical protein
MVQQLSLQCTNIGAGSNRGICISSSDAVQPDRKPDSAVGPLLDRGGRLELVQHHRPTNLESAADPLLLDDPLSSAFVSCTLQLDPLLIFECHVGHAGNRRVAPASRDK